MCTGFIRMVVGGMMICIISVSQLYAFEKTPIMHIGIVSDGPGVRFPDRASLFKEEILNLTSNEFDVRFSVVHGNWTYAGIKKAVDRLLTDKKIDLVIAAGVVGSNEICLVPSPDKPVIAAIVIDYKLQGVPWHKGVSGVKNLCYINSFKSFKRDAKVFYEINSFKKLTVVADSLVLESIPRLRLLIDMISREHTAKVEIVAAKTSAKKLLGSISSDTDAVFVTPLVRFSTGEFQEFTDGLISRRLPSFSMLGREEVEVGIFASISPKSNFPRLARRVALNVQRIFLGEDPGDIDTGFSMGEELTINMATARAIDVHPGWSILTEANLIHEAFETSGRKLSLEAAVTEAVTANLDLMADDKRVLVAEEDVRRANAVLRPQVEISSTGLLIDHDRAKASGGQAPEFSWSASAGLSQILYSQKLYSNYKAEQDIQASIKAEHESLKLDIVLKTSTAYLNVLRSQTLEKIRKDNLQLIRANLGRARIRKSVGIAGPAEVYRWESEIATSRKEVIQAESQTRNSMIALNRLLHRPLEEPFTLKDTDINDPILLVSDKRFFQYVGNPKTFAVFRDFMVKEGIKASPELRGIDFALNAGRRLLVSAKKSFWSPRVALEGKVTEVFSRNGAGTAPSRQLPLPGTDDTEWQIAINATLPIYEGGAKRSAVSRAGRELSRLRIQRRSLMEKIGENIRMALYQTKVSYPSMELSDDAAVAAKKNLELITDAYVRGVVSIIDLLDAQNASLVANQLAADSVYAFITDLMSVQRSVGKFDFYMTPMERDAWFQRIEAYFQLSSKQ